MDTIVYSDLIVLIINIIVITCIKRKPRWMKILIAVNVFFALFSLAAYTIGHFS